MSVSLYTVKAVLLLDSEGKTILARYYRKGNEIPNQKAFEKTLFEKTPGEIVLHDGNIICYKCISDMFFYIVGSADENELLLSCVLSAYTEACSLLLKHQVEKRYILESFDLIILALDETIDDGIILEVDASQIVARVSKRGHDSAEVAAAEQTLLQAYQTAKERFTSTLLK